jgi:hypothetical protein
MFGWLGKRGADSDDTRDYLDSLTGSPAAVLQQVIDWVEENQAADQFDPALLHAADTRLEPVLAEIAALPRGGQALLRSHAERMSRAYGKIARRLPEGHADRQPAALSALHLLGRACRLARMSYDDPAALRKECIIQFVDIQRRGLAAERRRPAPGLPETSATQELAVLLLWETAPFDSLSLEQLVYLERFIIAQGKHIVLKAVPGATAPFAVLPDGRVVPPGGQIAVDRALLFVGPGLLAGQMAGIAKLPEDAEWPSWADVPLPRTDLQTLKSLAQRVGAAWERKKTARSSERQAREDSVRVTGGFHNIRRTVAYAAYVRAGGKLNAYDSHSAVISDRVRQVMVGLEKDHGTLSPVDILTAMEAIGDSNAVETWGAGDSSAQGYSLRVPGFRGWLAVGGLLAVREADQIEWRIAIVRRLFGAANARQVGVEILPGRPTPVGVGDEGRTDNVSLADLRDAILLTDSASFRLVTPFDCLPGSAYLIAGQHGRKPFTIDARLQSGADFSIYSCAPTSPDES